MNVTATENLYNAIHLTGARPRILFVSTAYVYGQPGLDELPIRSTARINAHDPYAASKWAAEQISVRFASEYQLQIVRIRTFNHVGPRQPTGFIVSDWARQVAAIEAGRVPAVLYVGNLDTRRDYSDVRDIVRAYRLLVCEARAFAAGTCGVFNLGSGMSRSGRDIVDRLRMLSAAQWDWRIDTHLCRSGEAAEIVADATPLRELTGWRPEIDFDITLRDTLNYWRSCAEGHT
jgi:GDP-4-dehydro-6-deoxy-D-mannose reductase